MEKALGIRVVRHITKKPAGDAVDLEKHFRCQYALVMLSLLPLHDIDMCDNPLSSHCCNVAMLRCLVQLQG